MTPPLSRRDVLTALAAVAAATVGSGTIGAQTPTAVVVFKDPSCGCCEAWITHMKANGFAPSVNNVPDTNAVKRTRGIPQPLWSCHTALVNGYVIEGHVPAADVRTLLAQKPKGVVGLTIPGMPASAPGMDVKPFQPYSVLTFDSQGRTTVFAAHTAS